MKTITLFVLTLFVLGTSNLMAQNYITVYKDCDYRGASQRLYEGQFGSRELGIGNDKISSIEIPRGMKVTVYQDDNFRGGSKILQSDVRCLTDVNREIGMITYPVSALKVLIPTTMSPKSLMEGLPEPIAAV